MDQILDLLNCPITTGFTGDKGSINTTTTTTATTNTTNTTELSQIGIETCDDWLRDWLMRKYLDYYSRCLQGEEEDGVFRSFFDHLETRDLILLVFASIFGAEGGGEGEKENDKFDKDIVETLVSPSDEILAELISNCSQSNRCSLFPSDILKLASVMHDNDSSKPLLKEISGIAISSSSSSSDSQEYSLKSYGNDIKDHSKEITQMAMTFGRTFQDKIKPWISAKGINPNGRKHSLQQHIFPDYSQVF